MELIALKLRKSPTLEKPPRAFCPEGLEALANGMIQTLREQKFGGRLSHFYVELLESRSISITYRCCESKYSSFVSLHEPYIQIAQPRMVSKIRLAIA